MKYVEVLKNSEQTKFPDKKDEWWRRTPISKIKNSIKKGRTSISKIKASDGDFKKRDDLSFYWFVLNDTLFYEKNSSVDVKVDFLENASKDFLLNFSRKPQEPYLANFALENSNIAIFVNFNDETVLDRPFLFDLNFDDALLPVIFVKSGKGSKLNFVLNYSGKTTFSAPYVYFVVEEGAFVEVDAVQNHSAGTVRVATNLFLVKEKARLNFNFFEIGSEISKNINEFYLIGKHADVFANGVMFATSGQFYENHSVQLHDFAETKSDLQIFSAAQTGGEVLHHGLIKIPTGRDNCDAYQNAKNLILDESAKIHAIPKLEIETNLVRCSHGTSVGNVFEDQLFYLETRGIPKEEARRLIVKGFFTAPISKIQNNIVRETVLRGIDDKLSEKHEH